MESNNSAKYSDYLQRTTKSSNIEKKIGIEGQQG